MMIYMSFVQPEPLQAQFMHSLTKILLQAATQLHITGTSCRSNWS